jgi:hypothetical protein
MHVDLSLMLRRLIPDEPFFPYGDRRDVQYPEKLPVCIKYWSFLSIVADLLLIAVGIVVDYSSFAIILFGVFMLGGPIWAMIGWNQLTKKINRRIDEGLSQFMIQLPFPSLQWLAVFGLAGQTLCLAFMVAISTIVEFRYR